MADDIKRSKEETFMLAQEIAVLAYGDPNVWSRMNHEGQQRFITIAQWHEEQVAQLILNEKAAEPEEGEFV